MDRNRWQAAKAESIVDVYAHGGSRVYAPLQRDGRFPDAPPRGGAVETEHFAPSHEAGLDTLAQYLPKGALDVKPKARAPACQWCAAMCSALPCCTGLKYGHTTS